MRGAPYRPQTQGKIQRWLPDPEEPDPTGKLLFTRHLDRQIGAFVEYYNHACYRESMNNVTPTDVYYGSAEAIIAECRRIKLATIANRRLHHRLLAA